VIARLTAPLLLAALALLLFADLVQHPTQVLYSDYSDFLAEHVPAKRFLVRSFQETGELPLWCPHSLAGSPFVHDPQVAMFYPPHWALLLLPEERVGAGLSWLVVMHVILAGWGTYAYARSRDLGVPAALVAACGFMFAGRWMLHLLAAGHYITVGLAWLPWVLLLLEGAVRRRSFARATAAGAVFGLLLLGTQPQWTLYSGLFLALWVFGATLAETPWPDRRGALIRWAGYGAWTAVLGGALGAVQLLPTWEAGTLSTRSAGMDAADILGGGLRALLFFVGPALKAAPTCLMWEDRGGFGLVWVLAAALAPFLCRGRVRFEAGVCLGLIVFALGGALAFQFLPGFRYFRQPARMLLVAALPVALLAGQTTQAIFNGACQAAELRALGRRVLTRVCVAAVILTGGFALRLVLQGDLPRAHVYWLTLAVTLPAVYWLLGPKNSVLATRAGQLVWALVLFLDVWALARPLAGVRPEAEVYRPSACVEMLEPALRDGRRILDRDAPGLDAGTPLGGGAPLAMLTGLEPLRGYNPLDNRRYKEYLQFITGADEPLHPLDGPLTFPVIGNFPIRNKALLDLLGTGYALQPTAFADSEDWRLQGPGWRPIGEDADAAGYDLVSGGRRPLPAYTVYENTQVFPRAFIVPEARALPERPGLLEVLTETDFRACVLLEGWDGATRPGGAEAGYRPAELTERQPNRVTVHVEPGPAGYLVLTDLSYPGWTCRVDGRSVPLYRADYLFRAVELPPGGHTVTFTFEPESYRRGRAISTAALAVVVVTLLFGWAVERRRLVQDPAVTGP
jgi:hypothetical protein